MIYNKYNDNHKSHDSTINSLNFLYIIIGRNSIVKLVRLLSPYLSSSSQLSSHI